MAPTKKGEKKKGRSAINEVVTREYTINVHKRIHGVWVLQGHRQRALDGLDSGTLLHKSWCWLNMFASCREVVLHTEAWNTTTHLKSIDVQVVERCPESSSGLEPATLWLPKSGP